MLQYRYIYNSPALGFISKLTPETISKILMRFLFPNCPKHDCLCVGSARCGNIKTFCLSRIEKVMPFVSVTSWLCNSVTIKLGFYQHLAVSLQHLSLSFCLGFPGFISPWEREREVSLCLCIKIEMRSLSTIRKYSGTQLHLSHTTMGAETGKAWQSSVEAPPELVTFYWLGFSDRKQEHPPR